MNDTAYIKLGPKAQDFSGVRVSKLLGLGPVRKRGQHVIWRCRCDCGAITEVAATHLQEVLKGSRGTHSCGCQRRASAAARQTTHGHSDTPEYAIWRSMITRCGTKSDTNYHKYGARGIRVCEAWLGPAGFMAFITHAGWRPNKRMSIDRKNNDGNYEPGNVHWTSAASQAMNRRNTRHVTWKGREMPLRDACEVANVNYKIIHNRLSKGMSFDDAASLPTRPYTGTN